LNICDWQECTTGGTIYGKGDYLRAMDSPRGSIIRCTMYGPWFCCGQTILGGNHIWQSYVQELASFPGCTMVLGTRLAQEYVTSTRIIVKTHGLHVPLLKQKTGVTNSHLRYSMQTSNSQVIGLGHATWGHRQSM